MIEQTLRKASVYFVDYIPSREPFQVVGTKSGVALWDAAGVIRRGWYRTAKGKSTGAKERSPKYPQRGTDGREAHTGPDGYTVP